MENLVKYPKEHHDYIINGGILIYDYNKKVGTSMSSLNELNKKMEDSKELMIEREKSFKLGEKIAQIEREKDDYKEKIMKMEKKNAETREIFLNKEIDIKTNLYAVFEKKIREKDEQIVNIRDNIIKKEEAKYEYLKKELEIERENRKTEINRMQDWLNTEKNNNEYLKKRFEDDLEKEVSNQTQGYKEELEELKKQLKEYYDKYENKNKGKIFEEEFYRMVEEYNDKEEGNKWKISHVGSKYGGMCDIIFQHKDTGQIILVESKNNLEKNPVPTKDVDKFYRDVLDVTNNAIGGIIISTAKIQKKRSFEREVVQNKTLIFISYFSLNNIGQLFCNLESIIGENQLHNNELSKEERNELLIKQFDFYIDEGNFHKTRSKRAYDKSEEIRDIYYKLNKEDIKILKNDEKKVKKEKKQKKVEKSEKKVKKKVNFEELEENCDNVKKINNVKQSKFYLKYKTELGEIILQYFSDNHKMKIKLEKLKNEKKEIITHSIIKKNKKLEKKHENVNNIKIDTIFDKKI